VCIYGPENSRNLTQQISASCSTSAAVVVECNMKLPFFLLTKPQQSQPQGYQSPSYNSPHHSTSRRKRRPVPAALLGAACLRSTGQRNQSGFLSRPLFPIQSNGNGSESIRTYLHLRLEVWRCFDLRRHLRSHEARRDAVDADAVRRPFHCQGVGHVA
jgi:hypothetical protein